MKNLKKSSDLSIIWPPEISRGFPASPQSDIYAAGITLFELMTGRVPFNDSDPVKVVVAHIREKVPSPKKIHPSIVQKKWKKSSLNQQLEVLKNVITLPKISTMI